MNHSYDKQKAVSLMAGVRSALTSLDVDISSPTLLSEVEVQGLQLVDTKYPPSTRVMVAHRDGEAEEAVFRTFGVVCGKNLPPYYEKPAATSLRQIRNLKQEVRITGFDSAGFERDRAQLQEIEGLFSTHAPGRTVLPCEFIPFEGHQCIDIHARFFTDRALVPYDQNQQFLPGVDPLGVLSTMQPDDFIHGPDNVVEYCRRFTDENGVCYVPYEPAYFKVGDVVEVAFSCVAVPIKNNRMRMLLNLRALTLVDDSIRKDAERASNQTGMATMRRTPKRKALYLNFDYSKPYEKRRRTSPYPAPNPPALLSDRRAMVHGQTEASDVGIGSSTAGARGEEIEKGQCDWIVRSGRDTEGEWMNADTAKLSLDAAVESMTIDDQ